MQRRLPLELFTLLENWLFGCYSCIKWNNFWSGFLKMEYGVRQGSVLSPFLFTVYVDDLARLCLSRKGIYIILYADDILIVARSVCELENVLHICEEELNYLDMVISNKKSCCIRIGPRFRMCQPMHYFWFCYSLG